VTEQPVSILVFGRTGQLGRALVAAAGPGVQLRSLARADANFLEPRSVAEAVMAARDADVVINAAAYTAVDRAESEETAARRVNAESVGALAQACRARGLPLIHVSTNYVFDGAKASPYTEDDAARPLNAYGRSKLAGEDAIRAALDGHVIVRTSWLYSAEGDNFVRTMLRLGRVQDAVSVVDDQHGTPTSAASLAAALIAIATRIARAPPVDCFGTFHYTGVGEATWCEFARAIFAAAGLETTVIPITSAAYPTAARRPSNGVLDCGKIDRAFGFSRPHWRDELARVAGEMAEW
jgi:dTDP-4-dehydrorhamnose reductase